MGVKKEIEQASEYMGTLNEAFDNGNLQQNMLDMDAFSGVTEVKLVAKLNVQKATRILTLPRNSSGHASLVVCVCLISRTRSVTPSSRPWPPVVVRRRSTF